MVDYAFHHQQALKTLNVDAVARAALFIIDRIKNNQTIFVCGNGGSAAIANHLECDFAKGIPTTTKGPLRPKIVSLCRLELVTAYGNDHGYETVFWRQMMEASRPGDLLITMSVSGHSSNMVEAARRHSPTIAMTGFDGGVLGKVCDVHIHVDSNNYGICEDIFQTIMHMIAQYIRLANMEPHLIKEMNF